MTQIKRRGGEKKGGEKKRGTKKGKEEGMEMKNIKNYKKKTKKKHCLDKCTLQRAGQKSLIWGF